MDLYWLMSTYLPVVLVAQGNLKYTPLIVYKGIQRNITVYKFELGHTESGVDNGWQLINGINREDGEFTYVYVQTEPNFSDRVFGHEWLICQLTYLTWTMDFIVTDTITSNKCKKMRMRGKADGSGAILLSATEKGKFYVPKFSVEKDNIKVLVDLCYSNGIFTTSLRERIVPCPRGSEKIGGEAMMLKRYKGIACQPPPVNDTLTKFSTSNWVDMVYPGTVNVICAPGYDVKGSSTYKCSHSVWNKPFQNCTVPAASSRASWIATIAIAISLSVIVTAMCTALIVYKIAKKSRNRHISHPPDNLNPTYQSSFEPVIYEEIPENMYEELQPDAGQSRNENSDDQNTYLRLLSLEKDGQPPQCP